MTDHITYCCAGRQAGSCRHEHKSVRTALECLEWARKHYNWSYMGIEYDRLIWPRNRENRRTSGSALPFSNPAGGIPFGVLGSTPKENPLCPP